MYGDTNESKNAWGKKTQIRKENSSLVETAKKRTEKQKGRVGLSTAPSA